MACTGIAARIRYKPSLRDVVVRKDVVATLRKEREGGQGRKWRGASRRIQQQLIDLEDDSKALELVFPQVIGNR